MTRNSGWTPERRALQARLIRRVSFPVGASVFALARRPSPPGASGPSGYNPPMETSPR